MAADFDTPTIAGESYVDILSGIRAKFEVVSTMSYGGAVQGSIPTNAVQFLDGRLQKWDGSSFQNAPISITGGGTGASTAGGARSALGVPQVGTLAGQVRTNGESDLLYVPTSRQVSTSGALTGGGTLDGDVTVSIADASTSAKGAVQLYNGLNSTSTSLALTAAQGKALLDAMPVDVGYYNATTLGASGDMTSGSAKVVRSGSLVVISGSFNWSSSSIPRELSAGAIPSWARPSTTKNNAYLLQGGGARSCTVFSSGSMQFSYYSWSGSLQSTTNSLGFTISYTV